MLLHGGEGEEKKHRRRRHMLPDPVLATGLAATAAVDSSSTIAISTTNFFCKDGRKISVGDCALFNPNQESSPPFIGIIRCLKSGKEDYLKLGVNWLYRPAEVKLGKGILLEAAPNEVFYSFHKDEISAASLLHPCKVAFLRKGVELPSGISSFVCRRVYDIESNRLWWLTDQDYINERQEEVDQLLDKTRLEMHAGVQSGGRSPKNLNVQTPGPQLKQGSDSVQNSSASFSTQVKGKKRDRGDQGTEPIKRERCSKTDDGEFSHPRLETMLKHEIAKITDRGGLVDDQGVEKLIQLMQPDRTEKKVELVGRVMLVDVLAATERDDCLVRFVQLRGLSVLDEWLQEVHKAKVGDASSPKESDKPTDEFLLVLLRALDKLPVNLHALQTCNVGKSVNLLRSHKNLEIQKKSRTLVDTWKKRVEAELRMNDTKSHGSPWQNRQGIAEAHGGNRRLGGPSEVSLKTSTTQPSASKSAPVKSCPGDAAAKTTSAASPISTRSSAPLYSSGSKDAHCKVPASNSNSDQPLATIREEKSSGSSSQSQNNSQNNSQSCSSEHAKTVCGSSLKEDARSSTAGSMNASKSSNGASRHRKLSNGFPGPVISGVSKETVLSKCGSANRNNPPEKVSQVNLERTSDVTPVDQTNSHRLIVRLPNPGRSPARSASGCSLDDPSSVVSRASSPGTSEKHDQGDRKVKGKSEACRDVNLESWQSSDLKDRLVASDEGDGSPGSLHRGEHRGSGNEVGKVPEASKTTPSGNDKVVSVSETKQEKLTDSSLISINALVESCVKASASMSVVDDVGMNLLASVAAGEMSKSDLVSPIGSPRRSSPVAEVSVSKSRLSCEDNPARIQGQIAGGTDGDAGKQANIVGNIQHATQVYNISGDGKTTTLTSEEKPKVEHCDKFLVSSITSQETADSFVKSDVKPDETIPASVRVSSVDKKEEGNECKGADQRDDKKKVATSWNGEVLPDLKMKLRNLSVVESKKVDYGDGKIAGRVAGSSMLVRSSTGVVRDVDNAAASVKVEKEVGEVLPCPLLVDGEKKNLVHEGLSGGTVTEQKVPPVIDHGAVKECAGEALHSSGSGKFSSADNAVELKLEKADALNASRHYDQSENQKMEQSNTVPSTLDDRVATGVGSVALGHSTVTGNSDKRAAVEPHSRGSTPCEELPSTREQETERCVKSSGSKLSGVEGDDLEECASTAEASSLSVAAGSDSAAKLDFDLNEGFPVDEGNQGDAVTSAAPVCTSIVHQPSPLQFSLSSMSSSLPASITVAAAAKGPFVLPENPLRSKGEIGWKGSAATSAFRRAEPRKVLEMSLGTSDISADVSATKQGRHPLDIDLNVADERVLEDMASQCTGQATCSDSGRVSSRGDLGRNDMFGSSVPVRSAAGFDLDLNRVDEDTDMGQFPASTSRRLEASLMPVRPSLPAGFTNGEVNVLRDFDLNSGPGVDELSTEPVSLRHHSKSTVPFLPPAAGVRTNNTELGSFSSWFSPGNSYPAVAIPSILPDRGEQNFPIVATAGGQRIFGPPNGATGFGPDAYRGQVLSSSPAVAFSPATPYSYPGFPFGPGFSVPSTSFSGGSATYIDSSTGGGLCFPNVPTQLLGPAGAVSSHYTRPPYVISLQDGAPNGGGESSRKWGRQGLDLNAGPGGPSDIEGRDERFPPSRQHSVAGTQALTEEQIRMYQATGAVLKRKEPEGGWDVERYSYKPPSWQ